jgi:hypothetical protein
LPSPCNPDILSTSLAGFRFFDLLRGYERISIIDSICTGHFDPGHMVVLEIDLADRNSVCAAPAPPPFAMRHFSVGELLGFAEELRSVERACFPKKLRFYGIEIEEPLIYSDRLTGILEDKLPGLVARIAEKERLQESAADIRGKTVAKASPGPSGPGILPGRSSTRDE